MTVLHRDGSPRGALHLFFKALDLISDKAGHLLGKAEVERDTMSSLDRRVYTQAACVCTYKLIVANCWRAAPLAIKGKYNQMLSCVGKRGLKP